MSVKKYDVGILGVWTGCNYGSIATYYALNRIITDMGYSVLMIDKPRLSNDPDVELQLTHSRRFANEHYNISKSYLIKEIAELNSICDTFVIGSDQVWNYGISKNFGKSYYLDFATDEKKKIAYAASFGHGADFAPDDERKKISDLMSRFDAISVRESDGVRICRDMYGIKAEQVLDPVFLADRKIFDDLAEKSDKNYEQPYIATYILDPTPEKKKAMLYVSEKLGYKLVNMLDGLPWLYDSNKQKLGLEAVENVQVEDWINIFKNSSFVITDSCHGASFALLYEKTFIPIVNKRRGYSRFKSLGDLFGFSDRLVADPEKILENDLLFKKMDYDKIKTILKNEKERCYAWLKNALTKKHFTSAINEDIKISVNRDEIEKLNSNRDFKNIRLLVTLLRDYGVKHIVLSPGGRDVPIVRMFEYNSQDFVLHRVTDERSAAYYGLGIATQLGAPVACVCTSGTAASNYLPAVTEAYYTGVPLIVITADRYSVYLDHGEDQTIPQKHIYSDVVKMEVSLPEADGWKNDYMARRDISLCILESTHNGFGPVHINVPVENITIGAGLPKEEWKLLPRISPHILRTGFVDGQTDIFRWVTSLKRSPKILLVYGQNAPLSDDKIKHINAFANKYNCVIATDPISNLHCDYSLQPYEMLRALQQNEFDELLAPDILISVGGKRLMNDTLTTKVRNSRKPIRHWQVCADGKAKDFYFKLTSIIESAQDNFFEWFSEKAGDIHNDGIFYEKWRELVAKYGPPVVTRFNSLYVQSKFLPSIPANSVLHLGVGQSFIECRRFHIDNTVQVYCNMGTNGIDGCTSTFMGQCAVVNDRLCFLLVGDLSFFYDMNSIWNKPLKKNIRILLVNNNGTGLLRGHRLQAVSSVHNTSAEGWVRSTGFEYISARSIEEYNEKLKYFVSNKPEKALLFEVFCE